MFRRRFQRALRVLGPSLRFQHALILVLSRHEGVPLVVRVRRKRKLRNLRAFFSGILVLFGLSRLFLAVTQRGEEH